MMKVYCRRHERAKDGGDIVASIAPTGRARGEKREKKRKAPTFLFSISSFSRAPARRDSASLRDAPFAPKDTTSKDF